MKTVTMSILAVLLATPLLAEPIKPIVGQDGYMAYCAACHGNDGRGNGPEAADLPTPPADLTQLAENNSGVFPFGDVIHTIDGRIPLKGHGGPMPIFGELFAEDFNSANAPYIGEEIIRGRILALAYYLESIQELGI